MSAAWSSKIENLLLLLLLLTLLVLCDVGRSLETFVIIALYQSTFTIPYHTMGGSVAEWLAFWTQVQKGLGSNRSRHAVSGNSLRQTVPLFTKQQNW